MNKLDKESVIGMAALLVHAANIDEIYSDHEKDLIRNFIKSYLEKENTVRFRKISWNTFEENGVNLFFSFVETGVCK